MTSGPEDFVAQLRRERELRMRGYREQALKLFPAICGRCGREFEGKKLRELTVHHKDHDHENETDYNCKVDARNSQQFGGHILEHGISNPGKITGGSRYGIGKWISGISKVKP